MKMRRTGILAEQDWVELSMYRWAYSELPSLVDMNVLRKGLS
jgi:hypothetical protein